MTSVFDISTYKSAAIAGALYYLLQTETATTLIENVLPVSEPNKRPKGSRDTTPVIITKAIIAIVGFRILENMFNGSEEDAE